MCEYELSYGMGHDRARTVEESICDVKSLFVTKFLLYAKFLTCSNWRSPSYVTCVHTFVDALPTMFVFFVVFYEVPPLKESKKLQI